jgi:hypothetical protein
MELRRQIELPVSFGAPQGDPNLIKRVVISR